jgi:gentisate 1,2-dioxygenase
MLTSFRPADPCPWRFPWKDVEAAFQTMSGTHRIHHYRSNGAHLSKTLSAQAEMIEAGHTTETSQESVSFIYHIYQGEGQTTVKTPEGKDLTIDWVAKDTFTVPSWSKVQHTVRDTSTAYLFAVNDRPMIESLGLYHKAASKR